MIGALLAGTVTRHVGLGRAFAVGCIAFPAPLALVPLASGGSTETFAFVFLAEFCSGIGVMLLDISVGTILAETIPGSLRARVGGAYRTVNYGVRPLGALSGGLLGSTLGLRPTLWLAVIGATASVGWLLPSPLVRNRERKGPHRSDRRSARTATS